MIFGFKMSITLSPNCLLFNLDGFQASCWYSPARYGSASGGHSSPSTRGVAEAAGEKNHFLKIFQFWMRGTLPGVPPEDESWVAMIGRSTSKNVRAAKVWNLEFKKKFSFKCNCFRKPRWSRLSWRRGDRSEPLGRELHIFSASLLHWLKVQTEKFFAQGSFGFCLRKRLLPRRCCCGWVDGANQRHNLFSAKDRGTLAVI